MAKQNQEIYRRTAGELEEWLPPAPDSKKGKVWLVGFGPGDPALLTFKADRILSRADVIFYDDLIDDSVLRRYPAKAVYVGKRKGYHAVEQQDINEQMSAAAGEGLTVVRLKGGDPSIFGRVGEEISFLRARDIEVEMIPGVTAACASAAALCLPLTQRDVASEIVIRTGHGNEESEKRVAAGDRCVLHGRYLPEENRAGSPIRRI